MNIDAIAEQYAETTVDYANMGYSHYYVRRLVAAAFKAGVEYREREFTNLLAELREREAETLRKLA